MILELEPRTEVHKVFILCIVNIKLYRKTLDNEGMGVICNFWSIISPEMAKTDILMVAQMPQVPSI